MSDSAPKPPAKSSPVASPVLLELLAARGPSGYEQRAGGRLERGRELVR